MTGEYAEAMRWYVQAMVHYLAALGVTPVHIMTSDRTNQP